jgi:hypothetical protein
MTKSTLRPPAKTLSRLLARDFHLSSATAKLAAANIQSIADTLANSHIAEMSDELVDGKHCGPTDDQNVTEVTSCQKTSK